MTDILRVLIVDDDAYVCNGLKAMIPWGDLNAEVIGVAENGEVAWHMAIEVKPDLIISDIKMPVMDGLELCRRVYEIMPETRIILLSAHEEFDYAMTALRYRVAGYILKPVDREKIAQLVAEISRLSEERKSKNSLYKVIYHEDLGKKILSAFCDEDAGFFDKLLDDYITGYILTIREIREICIEFVKALFQYLKASGFNMEAVNFSQNSAFGEIHNGRTSEEIVQYTREMFLGILQFTVKEKDSRQDGITAYVRKMVAENHMDTNFSVSYLAECINITPAHLSMVFRQSTGINISKHITDVRMEHASRLLEDPSLTMADISRMVGYQDAHYFARVFKKHIGLTPSEYRNLKMKG